jgi:hypothetical protein
MIGFQDFMESDTCHMKIPSSKPLLLKTAYADNPPDNRLNREG